MIFIYVLKCPLSGRPRYVGKTQNPDTRLATHICKAITGQTSHHCARWIRTLIEKGLQPRFEVVFEVPADEEWQVHEKRFISEYLDSGFDLTNLTGGGGGFYKANPDIIARRAKARSITIAKPEVKERMRASFRDAHARPDVKQRHSDATKQAWLDPDKKQRLIEGMNTPEAKQRRADATRRRYDDPDFAKADRERKRAAFQADPARREQIRQAVLKRWADYRARKQETKTP